MTTRLVVFVVLVTAVLAGCGTTAPSSVSRGPSLSAVVLKASQVGSGYRLKMRRDSHCVQRCVTLDLCGFHFQSEAVRTTRLQVNYVKNPKALGLSNEVVRYQSGGSAFAIQELKRAVATCPHHPVESAVAGVPPLTYRIHRFTASQLLTGAVALRITVSGTARGRPVTITGVVIYQVSGTLLSGVYVTVSAGSNLAAALHFAVHAARASATNLEHG